MDGSASADSHVGVRPSVAIVHDYLTQRGGAERVVLAITRAFPDAPLVTSLLDPDATFPEFSQRPVRTTVLNRVPLLRRHHRLGLPLFAPVFGHLTVDAEVTLCSSSGWAHGVRTTGRKLVYCNAPARWLHQRQSYTAESSWPVRAGLRLTSAPLRRWDRRAAHSADRYLANSRNVRDAVQRAYGIDAEVVLPPVTFGPDGPATAVAGVDPGFALVVSRLLPYKNVDAVVTAMVDRPDERLVVVGDGPDEQRLRAMAPSNVRFLRTVNDSELRWLYANADVLFALGTEDLGLTPVEAARFGTPTIARRAG